MKIKVIFFDLGETLVTQNRGWISGAKETLAALREKNLRLGIISNTSNLTRAQLAAILPADFDFQMFETGLIILSSEVGVEKPSLEIFKIAVQKAGIQAKKCLYVSENQTETLAAKQAELKSVNISPPPNSNIGNLNSILTQANLI